MCACCFFPQVHVIKSTALMRLRLLFIRFQWTTWVDANQTLQRVYYESMLIWCGWIHWEFTFTRTLCHTVVAPFECKNWNAHCLRKGSVHCARPAVCVCVIQPANVTINSVFEVWHFAENGCNAWLGFSFAGCSVTWNPMYTQWCHICFCESCINPFY